MDPKFYLQQNQIKYLDKSLAILIIVQELSTDVRQVAKNLYQKVRLQRTIA